MSVSLSVSPPKLPETQGPPCQDNPEKILFVGEGNFSFTEAYIKKHPKVAHSIVATDYKKDYETDCELERIEYGSSYLCNRCTRIQELPKSGVKVFLGIDGTKLHETENLKPFKFSRIQWNCPHDGNDVKKGTNRLLIQSFFESCAKIQEISHRVHMTLVQLKENKSFYQCSLCNIVKAASAAGYILIKKRLFDSNRYPGYQHSQTNINISAKVTEEGMREFIFEKLDTKLFQSIRKSSSTLKSLAEALKKHSDKTYTIGEYSDHQMKRTLYYYECSTDDDSSDCESKE